MSSVTQIKLQIKPTAKRDSVLNKSAEKASVNAGSRNSSTSDSTKLPATSAVPLDLKIGSSGGAGSVTVKPVSSRTSGSLKQTRGAVTQKSFGSTSLKNESEKSGAEKALQTFKAEDRSVLKKKDKQVREDVSVTKTEFSQDGHLSSAKVHSTFTGAKEASTRNKSGHSPLVRGLSDASGKPAELLINLPCTGSITKDVDSSRKATNESGCGKSQEDKDRHENKNTESVKCFDKKSAANNQAREIDRDRVQVKATADSGDVGALVSDGRIKAETVDPVKSKQSGHLKVGFPKGKKLELSCNTVATKSLDLGNWYGSPTINKNCEEKQDHVSYLKSAHNQTVDENLPVSGSVDLQKTSVKSIQEKGINFGLSKDQTSEKYKVQVTGENNNCGNTSNSVVKEKQNVVNVQDAESGRRQTNEILESRKDTNIERSLPEVTISRCTGDLKVKTNEKLRQILLNALEKRSQGASEESANNINTGKSLTESRVKMVSSSEKKMTNLEREKLLLSKGLKEQILQKKEEHEARLMEQEKKMDFDEDDKTECTPSKVKVKMGENGCEPGNMIDELQKYLLKRFGPVVTNFTDKSDFKSETSLVSETNLSSDDLSDKPVDSKREEIADAKPVPQVKTGVDNFIPHPIFFKTSIKKDPGSKLHDQLISELGSVLRKREGKTEESGDDSGKVKDTRDKSEINFPKRRVSAKGNKVLGNKALLASLESQLQRTLHKNKIFQRQRLKVIDLESVEVGEKDESEQSSSISVKETPSLSNKTGAKLILDTEKVSKEVSEGDDVSHDRVPSPTAAVPPEVSSQENDKNVNNDEELYVYAYEHPSGRTEGVICSVERRESTRDSLGRPRKYLTCINIVAEKATIPEGKSAANFSDCLLLVKCELYRLLSLYCNEIVHKF